MVTSAHTIQLAGDFRREEALAGETISPGHLVEFYNASGTGKFRKHATAKGFGERAFAIEDAYQGNTIDDDYASGDLCHVNIAEPGSLIQAWLKAGENVVIGDKLISSGDGTLKKITGTADLQVFAIALEALDLSASGAVATRIDVRVL